MPTHTNTREPTNKQRVLPAKFPGAKPAKKEREREGRKERKRERREKRKKETKFRIFIISRYLTVSPENTRFKLVDTNISGDPEYEWLHSYL